MRDAGTFTETRTDNRDRRGHTRQSRRGERQPREDRNRCAIERRRHTLGSERLLRQKRGDKPRINFSSATAINTSRSSESLIHQLPMDGRYQLEIKDEINGTFCELNQT